MTRRQRAILRRRRARERARATVACGAAILCGAVIAIAGSETATMIIPETVEATMPPYYMTEEYQEMKRQEAAQASMEAEELRQSIERYNQEQQEKAEREFWAAQEEWHSEMEAEAEGFTLYEIPEEYARYGGSFPADIQRYAWEKCQENGIEYTKYIALIEQESGYDYDCEGKDGDQGYAQVIPRFHEELMERLGCTDMTDPYENIKVSTAFLGDLLEEYEGSYEKALTAYNAGQDGAYKYWFSAGVDASPYAKQVLKRAARIEAEIAEGE